MAHPRLRECEAKLRCARSDLEQLDRAIDGFKRSPVYRLTGYFDPPGSTYLYGRLEEKREPEDGLDWSVRIGCIAHNLRSALDYLVSILSEIDQQRSLTSDEVEMTEFPIFADQTKWADYKRRKSKGVESHGVALLSAEHRKAIDELQPCDPIHAARNRPLGWLQTLNNVDKHRALLVVATRLHAVSASIIDVNGAVETFQATHASTDLGPQMPLAQLHPVAPLRTESVDLRAEFNVVFADAAGSLQGLEVVATLRAIADTIHKDVFSRFAAAVGDLT